MHSNTSVYNRVRREDIYTPSRYWSVFMVFSFLVHVFSMTLVSNFTLNFLDSLTKPRTPISPILYVSLIYPGPTPLRQAQDRPKAKPMPGSRRTPSAVHGAAGKISQAKPALLHPVTNPALPVPTKNAQLADNMNKAASRGADSSGHKPEPAPAVNRSVQDKKATVTDKTEETVVNEPEPGTIILFKGTRETMLAMADLPASNADKVKMPYDEKKPASVAGQESARSERVVFSSGTTVKVLDIPVSKAVGMPVDTIAPAVAPLQTLQAQTSATGTEVYPGRTTIAPKFLEKSGTPATAYDDVTTVAAPGLEPPSFVHATSVSSPSALPADEKPEAPPLVVTGEKNAGLQLPRPNITIGPGSLVRDASILLAEAVYEQMVSYVKITGPSAGDTGQGMVEVKGAASGKGINSVFLRAGGRVMELLLRDGGFSTSLALDRGSNEIAVYASDSEGHEVKDSVTVNYIPVPRDFAVRVKYSGNGDGIRIKCKWRPHPLANKATHTTSPDFNVIEDSGAGQATVGNAIPGIYTVGLEYDTKQDKATDAVFEVTLYADEPSKKKARVIGPLKVRGKGYLPAVRVLLPEGIFWEDDGWFSGIIDSAQGTMKYKSPEGITWQEEN